MSKDNGGPAFPIVVEDSKYINEPGMSLRDAFAIAVLPAMVSAYVEANGRCIGTDHIHYNCAVHAYRMADAMLAERSKP